MAAAKRESSRKKKVETEQSYSGIGKRKPVQIKKEHTGGKTYGNINRANRGKF